MNIGVFVLRNLIFAIFASFIALNALANTCTTPPLGVVPDESSAGWKRAAGAQQGPQDDTIRVEYYEYTNGMKLVVYTFFNKAALKMWSCGKDRDPKVGNPPDHMIAVRQPDGSWQIERALKPEQIVASINANADIISFTVVLKGKKTVFSR